jgi:hypothetical protein
MFSVAWISGLLGRRRCSRCSPSWRCASSSPWHTQRSDHRTLIVAFFVLLPVQYMICGTRFFDLFTVFCRSTASWCCPSSARWPTTPTASWSATPRSSGA